MHEQVFRGWSHAGAAQMASRESVRVRLIFFVLGGRSAGGSVFILEYLIDAPWEHQALVWQAIF